MVCCLEEQLVQLKGVIRLQYLLGHPVPHLCTRLHKTHFLHFVGHHSCSAAC